MRMAAMQAVTRGSWLLVEDLNLAPPDVLAALVPLLDGGTLHLSHRSHVIRAAPGFQFIATVTAAPGAERRHCSVLHLVESGLAMVTRTRIASLPVQTPTSSKAFLCKNGLLTLSRTS